MVGIKPQVDLLVNLELVSGGGVLAQNKPMVNKPKKQLSLLGEVLYARLKELKKTQAWLAEQVGVSNYAVTKWMQKGQITLTNAKRVAAILNISMDQLTAFVKSDKEIAYEEAKETEFELGPGIASRGRIPVVGTAQLGDGGYWAELEYPTGHGDGHVEYSSTDENAYCLRCKGDSMRPRIKYGEYVVIEPNHQPQSGDEVLVKDTSGRVMIKELLYIRDGKVYLTSVNESHGKIIIPIEEIETMHYVAAIVKKRMWMPD
jgi:phage repressor protein C with HTH and peptisase S24 domain